MTTGEGRFRQDPLGVLVLVVSNKFKEKRRKGGKNWEEE